MHSAGSAAVLGNTNVSLDLKLPDGAGDLPPPHPPRREVVPRSTRVDSLAPVHRGDGACALSTAVQHGAASHYGACGASLEYQLPLYNLQVAQRELEARIGAQIVVQDFSIAWYRQCVSICKLYDFESGRRVGFDAPG